MGALLKLSSGVDAISGRIGNFIRWLVLASVLISAGNAIVRKLFNTSSNSFLEIQWYLFAAVFMLGAGFAFLRNVHVRIDFISNKLTKRTNAIIDAAGIVLFIIPLCVIMIDLGWPLFYTAWQTGEVSSNAGGLIRWPVMLLIPVGFALLMLQAASELIKRLAYLGGAIEEPISPDPSQSAAEPQDEEAAESTVKPDTQGR